LSYKDDYIFWRLAHFFIFEQGYRIVQIFENQKEIWLEKLEDKQTPIIRLFQHDVNWSNMIQRDIEWTAGNGEKIRKQVSLNELNIINIYVSPFPPVDEYEFRLVNPFIIPESNKTTVTSVLIASGIYDQAFTRLSSLYGEEINFPINEEYSLVEVDAFKNAILENALNKVNVEKAETHSYTPFFTYTLMLIQVAVFFWMETHGGSTNTATLIKYGENLIH
jgi:rhomboid protease GluP